MLRVQVIALILSSLFMTACQTSMLKQFSEIKPGMEKDDVLSLMGSPNQTQRFHGKDRWSYVFYDNRIRFEKEVHFFEGKSVYIGDIWQPEPEKSAVAVDAANEANNQALEEQAVRAREQHRVNYEAYETEHQKEAAKVRYLPTFVPIQ